MQLALWQDAPAAHSSSAIVERVTAAVRRQARSRPASETPLAPCERLDTLADAYVDQAHADRTKEAYRSDWKAFSAWCESRSETALPAATRTLERYLTHLAAAGRKASTIRRARIAIGLAHGHAGLPRPDAHARIRALERGIGRVHGTREEGAEPLQADDVVKLARALGRSPRDVRDRAMLLIGFAGALRPSELVALDVSSVSFTAEGLELFLARAKEDQLCKGDIVRVPSSLDPAACPVAAVRRWMVLVGRPAGPLFRHVRGTVIEHERLHPRAITRAVQHAAELAGVHGDYSGHSLRAGLATSSFAAGTRELDIQHHGRWKSLQSLHRYIHVERIRQRVNAATGLL